jgi:dynein assembly factor 2, axonemal
MTSLQTNTADHPEAVTRPKELILDIHLPLLESAAGVDLDVQERSLVLERSAPPRYKLNLALPFPVNESAGSAKFDKATRRLTVSLPVKPPAVAAPLPKTERLSSNDSGIDLAEQDEGYRTSGPAVSDEVAEEQSLNSQSACDDKPCDNAAPNAVMPRVDSNDGLDHRTTTTSEEAEEAAVVKDDFLDDSVSYSLPAFTTVVQPPVISFTLEVKNVDPSSVVKRVWAERGGVAVRFASLGAGLYPLHHAFAVQFLEVPDVGFSMDDADVDIGKRTVEH